MKHLFRFGSRWARRAAAMLPALPLLLLPATGHSAAPEAPPSQGFIKDMSPLLGENGRILAIAPDCRALTGIVDGRPFIWNRDFDSILLTPPSEYYGMGEALSDDGRTVIGFIRHRDEGAPPGYGQTWASLGFFWQYDKELLLMPQHGLVDVTWRGLSADGTVAAGKGMEPVPGAPGPDASGEELERFAQTPQGKEAMSRGYIQNRPLWFWMKGGNYRELDAFAHESAAPKRILSRDGKKILRTMSPTTHVRDLATGKERELLFGGAAATGMPDDNTKILRAGDPDNPLHRWGIAIAGPSRVLTDVELKKADRRSPLFRNWYVRDIAYCTPDFDARHVLCSVRLNEIHPSGRRISDELTLLARLDDTGKAVPIDDNKSVTYGSPDFGDISDNGKIVGRLSNES
ncbi:hypothetical protein [uncultured Desulfovibrio sp.]|uniref:hypothetical protein n=1 Tax=uncultured Desulfovibrio sp. TaxID=167968 RepID=UPI00260C5259|nr:hypothetical protein [uncultured Desulfovibrio sp.]